MLDRRRFCGLALGAAATALGCGPDETRYGASDVRALEEQRRRERERSGQGPFGPQRYAGYRGLAVLPWFEIDDRGRLVCVDDDVPLAIDVHAHLGMRYLLAPRMDYGVRTERVQHVLDCDAEDPPCPIDLDVYMNANFRPADLRKLYWAGLGRLLWGGGGTETHTIPNLVDEMDDSRIGRAVLLPIAAGLPIHDDQTDSWRRAVTASPYADRFVLGASVAPTDPEAPALLREYARKGARIVKLHPPLQRFYPDDPAIDPVYEECQSLGLPVFFHGGRAGIEPTSSHPYALMRHYEGAFRRFPKVRFVLGHAGARDVADVLTLAPRYRNVWVGTHGQGVTRLHDLIEHVSHDRLLFGTDWPFYHQCTSLAKVLIVTEERPPALRRAILRDNAVQLLELG